MPFVRTMPPLTLTPEDPRYLERLHRSQTAPRQQVDRAQLLLA